MCDSRAVCSTGLEILVAVKMLIKYDCAETFACLRESEVEEGRGVEGVKGKKKRKKERQGTGQVCT